MDLQDENNVLRYVPKKKLLTDDEGNVLGIFPQAFELREGEISLSVNWVEYFGRATLDENISEVKDSFERVRTVKKADRYAFGGVGEIIKACAEQGADKAKVVHDGHARNPTHSSIIRIPRNNLTLMEALAADAFRVLAP